MSVADVAHEPIAGPAAYSDAWYAMRQFDPDRERPVVFGASEAAAACGLIRYGGPENTPLGLYMQKRGQAERSIDDDTQEMFDVAHAMEPVILDFYRRRNPDLETRSAGSFHHSPRSWGNNEAAVT